MSYDTAEKQSLTITQFFLFWWTHTLRVELTLWQKVRKYIPEIMVKTLETQILEKTKQLEKLITSVQMFTNFSIFPTFLNKYNQVI